MLGFYKFHRSGYNECRCLGVLRDEDRSDVGPPLTEEEFKKALTVFRNEVDDGQTEESDAAGLFEGDIVLPDGTDPEEAMREVTKDDGKKWAKSDDGLVRVPYTIPGGLDEYGRWAIARVVQEYAAKTCIRYIATTVEGLNTHLANKSWTGDYVTVMIKPELIFF